MQPLHTFLRLDMYSFALFIKHYLFMPNILADDNKKDKILRPLTSINLLFQRLQQWSQ